MKRPLSHQFDAATQTLQVPVPGDLIGARVEVLRRAFFNLLEAQAVHELAWRTVQLDLTAMQRIDSPGLDLLVAILREVQQRDGHLQMIVGNQDIHRTLTHMELDKQMDLRLA
jgi:anti-anti-sigma factor